MTTNPYAVLELAPTRDIAVVKRAYFATLTKHPPQTDPEGFRRVRDAYELLLNPAALAAAFSSAPLDIAAIERDLALRFDARIEHSVHSMAAQQSAGVAVQQFIERFSGQAWTETLEMLPS